MNSFKNVIISEQSYYIKSQNEQKINLENEYSVLKQNNDYFSIRFKEVEKELANITANENKRILKDNSFYSLPSKNMTEMLRNSNNCDSTSLIKDQNNRKFENDNARNNYIKDHFKNLYSTPYTPLDTIENFLGNNINSELVQKHVLPPEISQQLEGSFTAAELQQAIDKANSDSADGVDGICTKAL